MEPSGLIAISVTMVLVVIAVLGFVIGIVLWCVARTRFVGPFVTFIPTLALLGAACGSWALALLVAEAAGPGSEAPLLGWLVGLPVGGVVGGLFGLALALRSRSRQVKNVVTL